MTVADRCDRCGAQAFTTFTVHGAMFMFCAHHWARHEQAILRQGGVLVEDERHRINRKPSVAATI